jgi:dihydroorotase
MNPPLRDPARTSRRCRRRLKDGTIDLIVTDHAPHHYDEKEREFADAPNGIVGLETALGVNVTWLLEPGILTLPQLVDRMACRPAKVFHLPGGTLAKGSLADVTVFDPSRAWTVDPTQFKSKGRNTPYGGRTLRGRALRTIVGGRIVYDLDG